MNTGRLWRQNMQTSLTNSNSILATATRYAGLGLSVIPVHSALDSDASLRKKPTIPWKPYQGQIATAVELGHMFNNGADVAVICGSVSGNLEVLDFDDPDLFKPYMDALAGHDIELVNKLLVSKTPSGGYHLLYRHTGSPEGNRKLAMSGDGKKVRLETRGQGGYALASPSQGYQLNGDLADLQTISKDERDLLIWISTTFNEHHRRELRQHHSNSGSGDRPGDVFNEKADWHQLLQEDGWGFCRKVGDREHWTRPGKKDGSSATLHLSKGLYVFSTNTSLPNECPLDPFGYVSHMRFNGDFGAAARWVRSEYPNEFKIRESDHIDHLDHIDHSDYRRPRIDHTVDHIKASPNNAPSQDCKNYAADITFFLDNYQGSFKNSDIDNEFNYRSREEKQRRSRALGRFEKSGKIKKIASSPGSWRTVNTNVQAMKRTGDGIKPFSIPFPLKIGTLTNLFPGNVITVAGETGAGKNRLLSLKCGQYFGDHTLKKREY